MPSEFSWIPFYREVAIEVLKRETKQSELLALLAGAARNGLKVISLADEDAAKNKIPLAEIDPFTFFAAFNRGGWENRKGICTTIKKEWNLSAAVPEDFQGIPTVNPQKSWFFSYAASRDVNDIPSLWQLARMVFDSTPEHLDSKVFSRCLEVKQVGLAKLTMGMFWLTPKGYIALDSLMRAYFEARNIEADWQAIKAGDADAYRALISDVHAKLGYNYPQISLDATKDLAAGEIVNVEPGDDPSETLPLFPLNQILYGPPGTGKTYNTINRAVEIINGEAPPDRKECAARFEELREAGQIGFVTFHQSFSYEEFIEGLRPVIDEDNEGGAHYKVRDGILKDMALRAIESLYLIPSATAMPVIASPDSQEPNSTSFDTLWERLCEKFQNGFLLDGLTTKHRFHLTINGNSISGKEVNDKSKPKCEVTKGQVAHIWQNMKIDQRPDPISILSAAGANQKATYERKTNLIGAIIGEMRRMAQTRVKTTQDTLDVNLSTDSNDTSPIWIGAVTRFVLIIDEINRGNISKIFGELITLLEPDKRLGETNALRVILPYSGDTFALPPNLYVIGTMNTADKSLALLDVALRRRFTFTEIRPDFTNESICTGLTPAMRAVLIELNKRIMLVLDREHRLGHSFFIGVQSPEDFNTVFADKIVPLLQEYFYNDWDGLRSVLGEKENGSIVGTMPQIEGVKGRNRYAWWHDLDQANPDFLAVLCKNFGIGNTSANSASDTETTSA